MILDTFNNIINYNIKPYSYDIYIKGFILVFLNAYSFLYIPYPIIPESMIKIIQQYLVVNVFMTFLLAYLITNDVNVSILTVIAMYTFSYLTNNRIGHQNADYESMTNNLNNTSNNSCKCTNPKKQLIETIKKNNKNNNNNNDNDNDIDNTNILGSFEFNKDNLSYLHAN